MKVFKTYAQYYDLLYQDKDYVGESDYVHQLIQDYAPGTKTLLELGCGTGKHAYCLSQHGYYIHGIDASAEMIRHAQERCSQLPSAFTGRIEEFYQGDLRNFQLKKKFDAIISLFHFVNYQITNADLLSTFTHMASHLKPGGLFLFDFWYGPAVLTSQPEVRVKRVETEDVRVTRIAEPVVSPNENCVTVHYEMLVEDVSTHKVEVIREIHDMRYLFYPELESLAAHSELTVMECSEWMTHAPLGLDSWSGVMVLKKNSDRSSQ